MRQIQDYLQKIGNKINLKQKEISYEKNAQRRLRLRKELNVLQLKREIAEIRKKIKQLDGR